MKIAFHEFKLPLKHAFTISRATTTVQTSLVVELEQDGRSGFGEATTNTYYDVSVDSMLAAIRTVEPLIRDYQFTSAESFWVDIASRLDEHKFAQCALDQAAHDLWGKLEGQPTYKLWNLDPANNVASNFTIGIDDIEVMNKKLREMPGWPVYKIKLGTDNDLQIIRALREQTDATFRVDANCGWTAQETIANSAELKALNVEFIEQPLPADQWSEMPRVFRESALPIIADESCIVETDVARCQGNFHGVNIKLMKCGGITPARRMIAEARQLGLKVMIGCMTESTVGISAIAQLLPLLDYVDMDGATLLASDVAEGAKVEKGVCVYNPSIPGHGVRLTSNVTM